MAQITKLMGALKLNGSSTEVYAKITTPALKKEDFAFAPPKDAVLKESLFGGFLGGKSTYPLPKTPPPPPAVKPPVVILRGKLVDARGTPLAGATVSPLSRDSSSAHFVINGVARNLTTSAISDLMQREFRDEQPVINGEVKRDLTKTSTDSQGRFQLQECPDGSFFLGQWLPLRIVTAAGHTYEVSSLVTSETIVHVPTLVNSPTKGVENVAAGELAGMVVDEDGQPLAEVDVDVWNAFPGNETKTDRSGVFRLKGFDRDEKIEVSFSKPEYSPEAFIKLPTGVSGWVLVLGKSTYFEGTVRTPDGKPASNATVRVDQGPKVRKRNISFGNSLAV